MNIYVDFMLCTCVNKRIIIIESDNSTVKILYDTDVFYKSKLFSNTCEMTSVISA